VMSAVLFCKRVMIIFLCLEWRVCLQRIWLFSIVLISLQVLAQLSGKTEQ
jgi:hypothetical protein